MYHLYSNNSNINVTGVTGLLRAFLLPRNSVKALPHNTFRHSVTAVTGFCTRAHVRNIFYFFSILSNLSSQSLKKLLARDDLPRNTCNTRNNHCFIYIFILFTRNKSVFSRNKCSSTRNNSLVFQQG